MSDTPDILQEAEDISAGETDKDLTKDSQSANTQEPVTDTKEPQNQPETTQPQETNPEDELKPQHVDQKYPILIPAEYDPKAATLAIPPAFEAYIKQKFDNVPNVGLESTEKINHWSDAITNGLRLVPMQQMYKNTLEDPDSHWAQEVNIEGKSLKAEKPQLTQTSGIISGERARLRFKAFMGVGYNLTIPLWHTGLWITFKAPSEGRLLELQRELIQDKIVFGRLTYGLSLSSMIATNVGRLMQLATEQTYYCNLKTDKPLMEIISANDIPTLIWGLAATIWNNGYNYERACTHDPEKCQHVEKGKIDLTKLQWVNDKALSPWCLAHMRRKKQGEITLEDIDRYKKEILQLQNRSIEAKVNNNTFKIDLSVPTAAQYLERSGEWIDSVTSAVSDSIEQSLSEEDRNRYILQNAQSTSLRQFAHWVQAIYFAESSVTDKETIDGILDDISADAPLRADIESQIRRYIEDSAISVIGIEDYKCPSCHKSQTYQPKNEYFKSIIPIDPLQTFFYLLVQKLAPVMSQ